MNKRITAVAFFLILITSVVLAETTKTDFSGNWILNIEKSGLQGAQGMRFMAARLAVKQACNVISIGRSFQREGEEERVVTDTLTMDGKECTSAGFFNSVKKSTAAWTADTLTIKSSTAFERDGNSFEMISTEIWRLKDIGQTLAINVTTVSPRGERRAALVYEKAEPVKKTP